MSAALNEVTYQRLDEFRRRRRVLTASRGWSTVVTVFVATLLLAVMIDAVSTHSLTRWLASSCVYIATLGTWFWSCWRPSRVREPLQLEAKRFEAADPRLREQLLTAVEFADHSREGLQDSVAFKELLQTQVANLLAPVDVRQLLPWHMVQRWFLVAATSLALLLLLSFIPQLHWMNRVARALFPAANLDRIARVAITIEEPQPNSRNIAAGDIVGIVARIDGPKPELVVIESRSGDSTPTLVPMQEKLDPTHSEAASTRFQGTISTDQAWIEYRISASGASTAWQRLTTQPRPDVQRFTKSLTPPSYAQLELVVQEEDQGNIRALIGTHVKLALQLNQPVSLAELRWQSTNSDIAAASQPTSLKLEQDTESGLHVTEFNVERSGAYRIHLQSAATGFINEFSPSYTVEAIMDQRPEIVWTQPNAAKQIVAPDQILKLAAQFQDEMPIASVKQLSRVNHEGQWKEIDVDSSKLTPFKVDVPQALAGNREFTTAGWQVDLLQHSTRVGNTVEIKLVAADRLNQTAESEVIEFMIAESTITRTPTPSEQLRMEVATALEAFEQAIKQSDQEIQELAKQKTPPQNDVEVQAQSEKMLETARTLNASIEEEVPKLLELIKQAASQTEDSASLLELEQTGQVLSMLRVRGAKELANVTKEFAQPNLESNPKRRAELSKEVAQRAHRLQETSQTTATAFRSMVSHDVGRRVLGQVAELEKVFANFGEKVQADKSNVEQHRRTATVLSRQLMELQQSMLDALPSVRQDTKQRLRQTADSISNMVSQLDSLPPQPDPSEMIKQTSQVEKTLAQMKNAAWFDGGLHDAIINGHRRLSEFGGQPVDQLRRAIANLAPPENANVDIKAATTEAVLENLDDRRALMRARKEGDREFASDLGNTTRAIREITQNESLTKTDRQRELNETAAALETLQAAHGVKESMALLEDLLRGERWSLNDSDAMINHPVLFDSFGERLENAVNLLRQARVPNELVESIERLRWHEANGKAGQKINSRRWENSPPVSAAPELNQLSEQLAAANAKLEPIIQKARAKIADQAPTLGELAQKAADATRELQQQTESLAKAVERKEVPDEATQLAQLKSEQQQAQQPIAELRDALVDHADSQNLLEQPQLLTAREADAALTVVDAAKEQIDASMDAALSSAMAPAESTEKAKSLDAAADQQAHAAENLARLAKHFESASQQASEPNNPSDQPNASNPLMELANELGNSAEAQQRYNEAAQLARMAAAKPEEVLRQLEQQLEKSPSMQQEMSRISQELAEQALNRLDRAADQQRRIQPALEASDPRFQAKKKLLLQDLQSTRDNANQVLSLLVSEAKWTSGAGKEEPSQKRIEAVENQLRTALTATEKVSAERTFEEIRAAAQTLAESLMTASDTLNNTAQSLKEASSREVHQNDADLANRRREMQDRQRRIAQQDVRNLQQAERQQQQLLRQAENEFKQTEQREKSLQQHLTNIQKEVAQRPDNQSLQQQLADARRNLGYGQAQKLAAEQTKQQMMQRVEQATTARDAATNKQQVELKTVNPSSQLASELAGTAGERSQQLAKQLDPWQDANALKPEANIAQLQSSSQEERAVHQSVQDSADDLSRAARHEQRLKSQPASQQLAAQSDAIEQLNANEVHSAEQALASAIEDAKRPAAATGQASTDHTQAALGNMQAADTAIRNRADQLRALLAESQAQAGQSSTSQAASESDDASLLDSKQLAQLLDEVDRQLNLGQKDNDSPSQPNSSPAGKQTPSTLAAAAEQISSQLSRNRQPSPQPNTDKGMATESTSANVDPQGPVAVKVIDVNRIGADWGKLRERASEDMIESKRESVSPAYRQQIEAYFRSLSERGQAMRPK
jgi:hypothetical protein